MDKYIERSKLLTTLRRAELDLLLFDLVQDDPIAWLAFRDAFGKLTKEQRQYLKNLL